MENISPRRLGEADRAGPARPAGAGVVGGEKWGNLMRHVVGLPPARGRAPRKALAEIVREAVEDGWADVGKAERWLDELERGRAAREGWLKHNVELKDGGYHAIKPVEREIQQLKAMGLEEGRHFSAEMPEGDKEDNAILEEILKRDAGGRRKLAAELAEHILQRARERGEAIHEKVLEVMEAGREEAP
jgi:hypothetical protein